MPRWFRIVLTAFYFLLFFGGSPLLSLLVFPFLRLTSRTPEEHRARVTQALHRALHLFSRIVAFADLAHAPDRVSLPEGIDPDKPYVMVTNHPSLIDAVFLLGWFENLTCVTKGSWRRSIALGSLLRQSNYLPADAGDREHDMLDRMVEHLRRGHPLLVFPEGSRSLPDRLLRFRRGAVEAAIRAQVPIVALYLDLDRPYLRKGEPFWRVPERAVQYTLEPLDVVDTADLTPADAKRINQELEMRFRERYAKTLERRGVSPRALPPTTPTSHHVPNA